MIKSLTTLHVSLQPLCETSVIPAPQIPNDDSKAWELGRQAYLNWAVGKIISESAGGGRGNGGAKLDRSLADGSGKLNASVMGMSTGRGDDAMKEVDVMMRYSDQGGLDKPTRSME